MSKISVSFDNGKYTIEQIGNEDVNLLRFGRTWVTDAPGKMMISVAYEVHVLRRLGAAAMKLRNGDMTGEQFDALVKELRGLTDFERDLNKPGTV